MKTYIVIGLGRFGSEVARRLSQLGCEVLAVDSNPDFVQAISGDVTHAVVADGTDVGVLRALGAADFDCGIVAIGGSLAASVLVTVNLKELNIPKIVCKAHDETHRQVLKKLGADQVVIPEQEQAYRLARSLSSQNVLDYIELSEDYGIIDLPSPGDWLGKTLKELNVRAKLGINILAVKSEKGINVSPSADYQIGKGDVLVILGDTAALKAVQKL